MTLGKPSANVQASENSFEELENVMKHLSMSKLADGTQTLPHPLLAWCNGHNSP